MPCRPRRRLDAFLLVAGLLCSWLAATPARASPQDFAQWLQTVRQDALGQGISAATLDVALANLQPNQRVIELDRSQPEFTLTFQQYLDRVEPETRIAEGRKMMEQHSKLLADVAAKFNVQPRFIVALWAVESDYGHSMGGFNVIEALATLAHDGRRSTFFRKELLAALHILDEKHITFEKMVGSWAGAMGQSQFLPTSFRQYAVDFDGDGRRDIWGDTADVLASIANYLSKLNWHGDQTWGRPVRLPANFDKSLADEKTEKPISEWRRLGVRRSDGGELPGRDLLASIVLPAGQSGPAFLVYPNYKTILYWNRSTYFATAVGLLADQLGSN